MPEDKGWIYAILDNSGNIKVGKTKNQQQRLRNLQTGNADKLKPLYWLHVDDMTKAENNAKALLKPWLKQGEWYRLDRQGMELLRKIFGAEIISEQTYKQLGLLGLRKIKEKEKT